MKKQKQYIIIYLVFILAFAIIYHSITNNTYLFASRKDFMYQHYLIPEYFRTLFYSTHDLFPDFNLNLGSGQNIYYFSYYGLLNPYILFSYLLPHINMIYYLITINILIIISSTILFFNYLKKNKYSTTTSFLTSFLLLTCGPLIFHAKRHIMFINYFPFLILGLYGIDKYISKKNFTLLTISISLIIFSSYYFSIPAIISLYIFLIYKLIKSKEKINISKIIETTIPFILGITISSILILPTSYIILNGRTSTINPMTINRLLKPSLLKSLLYSAYSPGLTLISLFSIIYCTIKKNKSNQFLSIICIILLSFPIFNYIFNGQLYINPKSLIPLIPLILILTAETIEKILPELNKNKQKLLIEYIIISSITICMITNYSDKLMTKNDITNEKYKTTNKLINQLTKKDNTFYRINNSVYNSRNINKVNNIKEYKSTIYSSTYNKEYVKLYNDILNNPIPNRNKFMLSPTNNIITEILLGEKYIITDKNITGLNITKIQEKNDIKIYKNESAFPIGYATNNIINTETLNSLTYPNSAINLLNNIIIDNTNNTNQAIIIPQKKIPYKIKEYKNLTLNNINENIIIDAKPLASMTIELNEDLKNKLLFLRINNNIDNNEDLSITINQIKNKLTDKNWKYYNENKTFDYCLHDTNLLNISFQQGKYQLNNFEMYILDYDTIKNTKKQLDPLIIDTKETKGDKIVGTINVTKDNSYFTITIPYDKGFEIKIDNQKTAYQKSGANFIAFPIKKGKHTIEIEYKAPLKTISLIISTLSIIILIIYNIIKRRRCKYEVDERIRKPRKTRAI